MRVNYTLTLVDYKAALMLDTRQKVGGFATYLVFYGIVPLLAILLSTISVVALALGDRRLFIRVIPVDAGLVWLAIFLPVMRVIAIRKGYKQILGPHPKDTGILIEVCDEYVLSRVSGVSEGKFFWNAIMDFAQDERITLLYVRKNRFLPVPTQAMSTTQRAELNDLLSRHLVRE